MQKLEQKKQENLAEASLPRVPEKEGAQLPVAKLPDRAEVDEQKKNVERRQKTSQAAAHERREIQEEALRRTHEKDVATALASAKALIASAARRGGVQNSHLFNRDALLLITQAYQARARTRVELGRMIGFVEGLSDVALGKLLVAVRAASKSDSGLAANSESLRAELKDLLVQLKGAGVNLKHLATQGSPEQDLLNSILALYIPPDKIADANDAIKGLVDEQGEILY